MLVLPDFYILTLRVTHALNKFIETILVTSASSVHFSGLCCSYTHLTFLLHCFELNHLTGLLNANTFSMALLKLFISSEMASVSGTKASPAI